MGNLKSNLTSSCTEDQMETTGPAEMRTPTQRENMATWHRTDIPVTDVYNIVETIGTGRMGDVYKVQRLAEDRGLHNSTTRIKSNSTNLDLSSHTNSKSARDRSESPPLQHIERDESSPSLHRVKTSVKPILRKPSRGNLSGMLAPAEPTPTTPTETGTECVVIERGDNNNSSMKDIDDGSVCSGGPSVCPGQITTKISSFLFDSDEEEDNVSQRSEVVITNVVTTKQSKRKARRLRFQRTYACKTVMTADIKKKQLTEMMNEIYIMRTLDHPYIIRLYEVYQVRQNIWMVMDLCTGGDLTTRKLNESQVVVVAEQILRGVVYLHRHGVCHQDLKLENILYEHSGMDATIRLIDFGISEKYDHARNSYAPGGAVYTMSPEISSGSGPYTTKSDVWAVGVIVWVLLAGDYPFLRRDEELKDKNKREALNNADYDYGITWRGRDITSQAKRFVAGCLRKSSDSRWSAKAALGFVKETWVPGLEAKEIRLAEKGASDVGSKKKTLEVNMNDITRFCECGLLKQTVLITMANTMDRAEVGDLQELFLLVDSENTGTISVQELREAFVTLGLPSHDDETLAKVFAVIDHDNSGQIHYAEFLAALAESHGLVTTDRLADAFDRIDADGKGFITHDDLKAILGENYKVDVVDKMIEEADFKKNGQVDYDELLELMFGKEDLIDLDTGEEKVMEVLSQ